MMGAGALAWMSIPLAKVGYADLFCLAPEAVGSKTEVSTRSDPVGGRVLVNAVDGGVEPVLPVPLEDASWFLLAEIRARSELPEVSLGSLFVLDERSRPTDCTGGGVLSEPGTPPAEGSSVWMKQQRLP
jgi:hypothetical protein